MVTTKALPKSTSTLSLLSGVIYLMRMDHRYILYMSPLLYYVCVWVGRCLYVSCVYCYSRMWLPYGRAIEERIKSSLLSDPKSFSLIICNSHVERFWPGKRESVSPRSIERGQGSDSIWLLGRLRMQCPGESSSWGREGNLLLLGRARQAIALWCFSVIGAISVLTGCGADPGSADISFFAIATRHPELFLSGDDEFLLVYDKRTPSVIPNEIEPKKAFRWHCPHLELHPQRIYDIQECLLLITAN